MINLVKVSIGEKTVHQLPGDVDNPIEASVPVQPSATPTVNYEARRRYEICKTCEQSESGGFKCRLHSGCCFGSWRANINNHCIEGKW